MYTYLVVHHHFLFSIQDKLTYVQPKILPLILYSLPVSDAFLKYDEIYDVIEITSFGS